MSVLIQVTGLPRSGTAFIATMLNLNPRCIAFHDVISTHQYWRVKLKEAREKFDYVADVGTYQYLPGASLHESRKVYVDRPAEQARKAAEEAFGYPVHEDYFAEVYAMTQSWVETHRPLVVNYASLWNVQSMENIWKHVFDKEDVFPEDKVSLLLFNDIQRRNPDKYFAKDSLSARVSELF